MSKAKVDSSEVLANEASARLENAQAAYKEIEVADRQYAQDVKNNADFRHGYFELCDTVSEHTVSQLLANLRRFSRTHWGKPIIIELCSPGGSIIDGFRLFDELVRLRINGHHLTIRVRGHAASMAAVLLQAGDKREVGNSSWFMIHRAAFGAMGKTFDVEDEVEFVKRLEGKITDIFVQRTGQAPEFFEKLFAARKDQWFDAEQCVELGFADEVL